VQANTAEGVSKLQRLVTKNFSEKSGMTTIYVGNLPFTATEDEVRGLFERYGKVDSVKLINDRETGRPRGFAFVDMAAGEAQNAIQQTNGFQMGGRPLRVNEAQERAPRSKPPGGGGGGGGPRRW
jgi:RNA recognition motif-containing protein